MTYPPQTAAADTDATTANHDPILRFQPACRHIGVGRSTAYALIRSGALDAPLKIGPRACGWRLSTLDAFLNSRSQTRGAA